MLPRELSTDLCSLRAGMDRYAMSVLVDYDINKKEIIYDSVWYGRTIVRSRYSLSYEQAQNMFDHKPPGEFTPPKRPDSGNMELDSSKFYKYHKTTGGPVNNKDISWLTKDITTLVYAARSLNKRREKNGALTIVSNELNFSVKNNELVVNPSSHIELHDTISEMMILGNELVAMKIHNILPDTTLLRIHPPPDKSKFKKLQELLKSKNIDLDIISDESLSLTLNKIKSEVDEYSFNYINTLLVRSLSEALYVCTGSFENKKEMVNNNNTSLYSHFGLGLDYYTHYTSPIRRYADLIVFIILIFQVHRLLVYCLEIDKIKNESKIIHNLNTAVLPEDSTISLLDNDLKSINKVLLNIKYQDNVYIPQYKLSKDNNLLTKLNQDSIVISNENIGKIKKDNIIYTGISKKEKQTLYSISELTEIANHCIYI